MSDRASDGPARSVTVRARLGEALLTLYFLLAPTSVPEWRLDLAHRPVAVLPIGEPTPSLAYRVMRDGGG